MTRVGFPVVVFHGVQVAVTLFLALVVGAIFYDVQDNQSGMQNRYSTTVVVLEQYVELGLKMQKLYY